MGHVGGEGIKRRELFFLPLLFFFCSLQDFFFAQQCLSRFRRPRLGFDEWFSGDISVLCLHL